MTEISAGDLVIAVPIADCRIGHPSWQQDFDHPEMTRRAYMVSWAGFSAYWGRPILAVAGRHGHYCAGCFAKQNLADPAAEKRVVRQLEPVT